MCQKSKFPFVRNVIITLTPASKHPLLITFSFYRRKSTSKRVAYAFQRAKNRDGDWNSLLFMGPFSSELIF